MTAKFPNLPARVGRLSVTKHPATCLTLASYGVGIVKTGNFGQTFN